MSMLLLVFFCDYDDIIAIWRRYVFFKLREAKQHLNITLDIDELDATTAETKATYERIKEYVAENNNGMKVSSLNIAQTKAEYGIRERENYNCSKSEYTRQPQCPREKEDAIVEAMKYYKML